jgi:hypothetical protein
MFPKLEKNYVKYTKGDLGETRIEGFPFPWTYPTAC